MAGEAETWIERGTSATRAALVRFWSCTSGASAIEYAMVAVLFAVATVATWRLTGSSVGRMYDRIGTSVIGAN